MVLVTVVATAGAAGCAASGRPGPAPAALVTDPISDEQGRQLLARTAELAHAGDFDGLCRQVASSESLCQNQISLAHANGHDATAGTPSVLSSTLLPAAGPGVSPVRVLKVSGIRADGSVYTADFTAQRTDPASPDTIRSITPIYWSGVTYQPACQATSGGGASCENTATSPHY